LFAEELMAISCIHTADFQIGKAFGSIGGDASIVLRRQRIETVRRIAELAAERNVDAVLVAGDVFDLDAVSNETIHTWLQAMAPYSGLWVVIPGNHDPAVPQSVWHRIEPLGPPANLHLSLEPEIFQLAGDRLAVLTAPLQRRHESGDPTSVWDEMPTPPQVVRVGLAHGTISSRDSAAFDATNPIAGNRETLSRLDYLALGDWHGTMQVGERSWYSGTPEKDHFKANDSGNLLVVNIDRPGATPVVEKVRVGRFRWCDQHWEVNGATDVAALDQKLLALSEPFHETVVSLSVTGTIDLETREKLDRLLETWRGRLLHLGEHLDGLIARPSEADLDRIDTGGFVRAAVERLRRAGTNRFDPDNPYAGDAIAMLYRIHAGGGAQ
jgi:DNA repair exonuclease SbcCD nuclease subunit